MGLDNGVLIKVNNLDLSKRLRGFKLEEYSNNLFEMFYWRKWYGLRSRIIHLFDGRYDEENCSITLELADLKVLFGVLKETYANEENWEEADSIWEFSESCRGKRAELKLARKVAKVLRKFKCGVDYTLEFYDSY